MTEKLYYNDAYIKEFYATVLSVCEEDNGYSVVLDATAFFPEEGGQSADTGYIGQCKVLDVKEKDGVIYHYTDSAPDVGAGVHCRLNFAERYDKMQCHTAEHILCGLAHKLYGVDNIGFHLGDDAVTMDLSEVLTREQLDKIEELANEAIFANVAVTTIFPTKEELSSLEYRSKLDITDGVRIVMIGEYDSCACCAPHVATTGEIGLVKILDFEKHRGGVRLWIVAGKRALLDYRARYTTAQRISALLSEPQSSIDSGVERLLSAYEELKGKIKLLRLEAARAHGESVATSSGNVVVVMPNATAEEMRELSAAALPKIEGMLVILTGTDGDYKYIISSRNIEVSNLAKQINAELSGRGGGRGYMIQGSFYTTLEEIKNYFEK